MRERKVWNEHEDNILRYLKQEKGEKKWSVIARKMEEEYEIPGRTGKQCRERYHNHLDSSIVAAEWTEQEDDILYFLHEQYGNKWSAIAQKLQGRSDNCVKNHFYSKLRKSVRRLNKFITDYLHKNHDFISPKLLSKIVEISESRFRSTLRIDEETIDYSIDLKNRLYKFENGCEVESEEQAQAARKLIQDIFFLEKNSHKPGKLIRKRTGSFDREEHLLHPKMCLKLKRSNSNLSEASDCSEDLSINFSSCGSSYDEEMEETKHRKRSMTTRSSKDIFSRNHSDMEDKESKRVSRKHQKKDAGNNSQRQKEDPSVYFQMIDEDFLSGNEGIDIRLSTSLIEQAGNSKERRNSKESRNSSSNKSNKSSRFKSFDAFCQFDEQMGFHWPLQDHQDGPLDSTQIIWRVIEPKQPQTTKVTIEEEDSLIPCLMDDEP